jgi:hypothetical protein
MDHSEASQNQTVEVRSQGECASNKMSYIPENGTEN